jgi:hypothetical protein
MISGGVRSVCRGDPRHERLGSIRDPAGAQRSMAASWFGVGPVGSHSGAGPGRSSPGPSLSPASLDYFRLDSGVEA